MKQLIEALRSARKIEIFIIAAVVCTLAVLWMGGGAQTATGSEEEVRMARILSRIEGAGSVSVMIASSEDGAATGVVVAASGAGDVRVMLEMQRAVRTLTGLELDRIEIVKSER